MNRDRVVPVAPRYDPELLLARQFTLPTARTFAIGGTARLSTFVSDDTIDRILGEPDGGVVARSSRTLPGTVKARASAAVDGDAATAWQTPFSDIKGQSLDITYPSVLTFDHLDLQVIADGRHSVPTRIEIRSDDGQTRDVTIPAVTDRSERNATAPVPVRFAPLTGKRFVVTVKDYRPVKTRQLDCDCDIDMPVGIAELGVPDAPVVRLPGAVPEVCRDDLLTVDGRGVGVRISGERAVAENMGALSLTTCDGAPLALGPGSHTVRSAVGTSYGIDVDRLVLGSAAGGGPWSAMSAQGDVTPARPSTGAPRTKVLKQGHTSATVRVTGARGPFWMVLGQSQNAGWHATVDGKDLGESRIVDGFGNGWLVDPPSGSGTFTIELQWQPERVVLGAIAVSVLGALACLVIVGFVLVRRRRRGRAAVEEEAPLDAAAPRTGAGPELADPRVAPGSRTSTLRTIVGTAVMALAGTVFVAPWAGVLVGLATLVVLVRPRWRVLVSLTPALALAICGAYVALKQYRSDVAPTFEWPAFFDAVRDVGWLAVVLLAADAVVELVRTVSRRPRDGS
jgi:hypothetical protein